MRKIAFFTAIAFLFALAIFAVNVMLGRLLREPFKAFANSMVAAGVVGGEDAVLINNLILLLKIVCTAALLLGLYHTVKRFFFSRGKKD